MTDDVRRYGNKKCSLPCGGGYYEYDKVDCFIKEHNITVDDQLCKDNYKSVTPINKDEPCNNQNCPGRNFYFIYF